MEAKNIQIGVITNPNSRKNRDRPARAQKLQAIVGDLGEVHATQSVDSIKPILREFLRRRAQYWVADGGDGALHWVLRHGLEILEEPEFKNQGIVLPLTLPTNGGTIDFVANNVGITGQVEDLLHSLRNAISSGSTIEEVEVDSMKITGIEINEQGEEEEFRTYGFASAVGGLGQRFFEKYYAEKDPSPKVILKVVGNTIASLPFAFTPLGKLPFPQQLGKYAHQMFEPAHVRVLIDGEELKETHFTGVHIASMSINLGGVFKLFSEADTKGSLHAIVGAPKPSDLLRNLPRMYRGKPLQGNNFVDKSCKVMEVEILGDELLSPIIDGEYYHNIKKIRFANGPRVRIPRISTQ